MMKKKLLLIIIIVAITAVVAFYSIKFFEEKVQTGWGNVEKMFEQEKSLMDIAESQGQKIMSKNEWINGCEKSDSESKDDCYSMGAVFYRDTDLCKNVKNSETREECEKNVEEYYEELENIGEKIKKLTPGEEAYQQYIEQLYMGDFLEGASSMPVENEENAGGEVFGGGGGATEDIYELSKERMIEWEEEMKKLTEQGKTTDEINEICIDLMAHHLYWSQLYFVKQDTTAGMEMSNKIDELYKKYEFTEDDYDVICNMKVGDPEFMDQVEKRMIELGFIIEY